MSIEFDDDQDEDSRIHFYRQICEGEDTTSYHELSSFVKSIRTGKLNTRPVSLPSMKAEAEKEAKWEYHKITLQQKELPPFSQQQSVPGDGKKEKFMWKVPTMTTTVAKKVEEDAKDDEDDDEEEEENAEPEIIPRLPRLLARGGGGQSQEPKKPYSGGASYERGRREDDVGSERTQSSFKNTKMCKHGARCMRQNQGCNYAHSMKDFSPVACKFKACRKGNACTFFHPDTETKEAFLTRISAM